MFFSIFLFKRRPGCGSCAPLWGTTSWAASFWRAEVTRGLEPSQQTADLQGSDRGWGGWAASLTQRTWVWANSGRWWRTGKPGVLRSMGSQRVWHHWIVTEQGQFGGMSVVQAGLHLKETKQLRKVNRSNQSLTPRIWRNSGLLRGTGPHSPSPGAVSPPRTRENWTEWSRREGPSCRPQASSPPSPFPPIQGRRPLSRGWEVRDLHPSGVQPYCKIQPSPSCQPSRTPAHPEPAAHKPPDVNLDTQFHQDRRQAVNSWLQGLGQQRLLGEFIFHPRMNHPCRTGEGKNLFIQLKNDCLKGIPLPWGSPAGLPAPRAMPPARCL